ncbi:MAG: anti-sigma factor family protein [Flavobacteriales bacterium]
MRSELEKIELIERYLLNQLNAEERKQFEQEMKENPSLQKEVEQQKDLMDGIKKQAFKDASSKAYKKYNFKKKLWQWGIGGALTILAAGVIIPLSVNNSDTDHPEDIKNVMAADSIAAADDNTNLKIQHFTINTAKDTVIETEGGIVLAIPASGFADAHGKTISGSVEIVVKEALTPSQIISAGLSTTSNGELLETGGMFYVNAFAGGQSLSIKKAIYAQVPTNEIKPGMMLFSGEKTKDGKINWVNPKALEKSLVPVEIASLNFYPKDYEPTLADQGYGNKNKEWKDSMYYSFAMNNAPVDTTTSIRNSLITDLNGNQIWYSDSISSEIAREINPSRIKAIWNKKFNNTLLATKEFEERLQVIFSSCDANVLNLYVNNLNKNMWEIDSMAAKMTVGQAQEKFLAFAERKDGGVKISDNRLKALGKYYETKRHAYQEAAQRTREQFYAQQRKLDEKFTAAQNKRQAKDAEIAVKNFDKELNKNLDEVYKQLGIKRIKIPTPLYYLVTLDTTGWNNVDRYVFEATVKRESTTITHKGKTAVMTYSPFDVEVENKNQYDRVYSYLLSSELYSFQRMNESTKGFSEKLNGFLTYNLAVVAYKGDSIFFFQQKDLPKTGGSTKVVFSSISQKELDKALESLTQQSKQKDILHDLEFGILKDKNDKRQKEHKEMEELRWKIISAIFPCEMLK